MIWFKVCMKKKNSLKNQFPNKIRIRWYKAPSYTTNNFEHTKSEHEKSMKTNRFFNVIFSYFTIFFWFDYKL